MAYSLGALGETGILTTLGHIRPELNLTTLRCRVRFVAEIDRRVLQRQPRGDAM